MPATLLRVDASFRTEGSTSRAVADSAQRARLREHPDREVVPRDLGRAPAHRPPRGRAGAGRRAALRGRPDGEVVRRDLGGSPLPSEAWGLAVGAAYTPEEQRTEEQRAAIAPTATLADQPVRAEPTLT